LDFKTLFALDPPMFDSFERKMFLAMQSSTSNIGGLGEVQLFELDWKSLQTLSMFFLYDVFKLQSLLYCWFASLCLGIGSPRHSIGLQGGGGGLVHRYPFFHVLVSISFDIFLFLFLGRIRLMRIEQKKSWPYFKKR